jgi:hypothetical protein
MPERNGKEKGTLSTVAGHALAEALKELVTTPARLAASVIAAAIATAFTYYSVDSRFRWYGVSIAVVAVLCACVAVFAIRRWRLRRQGSFHVIEKTISHTYHDLVHITHERKWRLRALRDDVTLWEDKYLWTGSGRMSMASRVAGQTIVYTVKQNIWQWYEVRLEKPLRNGEETTVHVAWDLYDDGHTARPFISTRIEEPTDALRMHLAACPELDAREVICETRAGIDANVTLSSERVTLDAQNSYVWTIDSPKLHTFYELRLLTPSEVVNNGSS